MNSHPPIIDVHVHLAGVGHGGTGCWISPRKWNSLVYRMLRRSLGLANLPPDVNVDLAYLECLEGDLGAAAEHGALDAVIVFPHERIYRDDGSLAAVQEMYIPNDYALACGRRSREQGEQLGRRWRLLPAMSVHPYRADALEETARCIAQGAVGMKWLPSSQNIDPRDARCRGIFDLLARHGLPLVAHTGSEHTVCVTRRDLGDPDVLLPALEAGVTVIMAHCATASLPWEKDFSGRFAQLARQYPNCYGDISALASPGRMHYLPRLLDAGLADRLVHGSDFPVPPVAWLALTRLGWRQTRDLARIPSRLERDVTIKKALGVPDAVFTRASSLLPAEALRRWGLTAT